MEGLLWTIGIVVGVIVFLMLLGTLANRESKSLYPMTDTLGGWDECDTNSGDTVFPVRNVEKEEVQAPVKMNVAEEHEALKESTDTTHLVDISKMDEEDVARILFEKVRSKGVELYVFSVDKSRVSIRVRN
jgi:hypothetical protein